MRLIQWQFHAEGGVEAIYAGASAEDTVWIGDDRGVFTEVLAVRERLGPDLTPDLVGATDAGLPPWRPIDGGGGVELDLAPRDNPDQLWRLSAAASRSGRFSFQDPLAETAIPVCDGRRYRFGLQIGGPARGVRVQLSFAGAAQLVVTSHALEPVERDERALRTLDFVAPAGAIAVSVELCSGAADVFSAGRPWLEELGAETPARSRLTLTRRGLAVLRACDAEGTVVRLRAPIPRQMLDGAQHSLALAIRGPGNQITEPGLPFRFEAAVDIAKSGIERASVVRLVGRLRQPAVRYLRLQAVIDGRPGPVQAFKANTAGKFDARLPIPPEHLDGRLHLIEVRLAESQAVLFAANAAAAAFHTRWPVLQLWSQPPLSPESSPAAGRHLKSLSAWVGRAHRGEAMPDVAALHDELLGGVRRRISYPKLAFPDVAAPDVSIIMPAHNKFEVTYAGLCALRFAPVEASFEVVLVDDGSSDETVHIEQIVTGLRVVRHAEGEGFVAACNDGAGHARGRYLCFLNNDTEVTAGWLDALLQPFADDPSTGLTGAKLIYPDGRLQEAGGIVWGTGDPWNAGRGGDPDAPDWNYRRQVDYLSGAAILTPAEVWGALGGFGQEWAPAYFEDTDFAMKVRASGRRVIYAPDAEVYHFEGQTAGTDKTEGVKLHQELNRPKFKAKWRELYGQHGPVVGERPDLEKDRAIASRVLVLAADLRFDGELAAALRKLRGEGAKATLWPLDLAWRPDALEWGRRGVEAVFAPYAGDAPTDAQVTDFDLVLAATPAAAVFRKALLAAAPNLKWVEFDRRRSQTGGPAAGADPFSGL